MVITGRPLGCNLIEHLKRNFFPVQGIRQVTDSFLVGATTTQQSGPRIEESENHDKTFLG